MAGALVFRGAAADDGRLLGRPLEGEHQVFEGNVKVDGTGPPEEESRDAQQRGGLMTPSLEESTSSGRAQALQQGTDSSPASGVGPSELRPSAPSSWTDRLRHALEENSKTTQLIERLVAVLILFSILDFTLESVPDLRRYERWFWWTEAVIVGLFTLEFAVRLLLARRRLRYLFSFEGLIDLAAILPFYLAVGDLRWLRGVRLLRLLRMAKLVRYGRAYSRLVTAVQSIRHELVLYLTMTGIVVYLAAVGMYYFERHAQPDVFQSIPHAMWWAVVTLTTVGYGDVVPVTAGGRAMTAVILVLSLGTVSVPSALLASALVKAREASPEDTSEQG